MRTIRLTIPVATLERTSKRLGALGILAAVLAGCGGASQQTQMDTSPGAYPANVQGELLGGCAGAATGDNLPAGYCECALKQLEANIPASQADTGNAYVDGEAMVKDGDIRRACG